MDIKLLTAKVFNCCPIKYYWSIFTHLKLYVIQKMIYICLIWNMYSIFLFDANWYANKNIKDYCSQALR